MAGGGFNSDQIGRQVGLRPSTVRNVLMQVRRRLGARTTAQAVVLALSAGIFTVDDVVAVGGHRE